MTHDEKAKILPDKMVKNARIVCDFCPQKDDPNRVGITGCGNLIDYSFDCTTQTAVVMTSKIM